MLISPLSRSTTTSSLPPPSAAAMDLKLLPVQEERKKDRKSKKDKKRKLAIEDSPPPPSTAAAMDPKLLPVQEEVSDKRKKDKKGKKDKKRKIAAENEAAAEEAAKCSKKRAADKDDSDQGGAVEKSVAVTGKGFDDPKYAPLESFAAAALPPKVLDCCKGFDRPSPIQALAWPYLLDGRDFIGIAATGSGTAISAPVRLFFRFILFVS
jgi:ATP-dependent RNA helicase DBP3